MVQPPKLKSKTIQQAYNRVSENNQNGDGGSSHEEEDDEEFDLHYEEDDGNQFDGHGNGYPATSVDYLHESSDEEEGNGIIMTGLGKETRNGTAPNSLSEDESESGAVTTPVKGAQQQQHADGGSSNKQSPGGRVEGQGKSGASVQSILVAFVTCRCTSIPTLYANIRSESRRRRMERAMVLDEDIAEGSCRRLNGSFMLCLSSWCDLTEFKGMFVAMSFTLTWWFCYHRLEEQAKSPEEEALRDLVLIIGVSVIAIRCLWWPVYWCICGERVRERQEGNMELYDGLNGDFSYEDDDMGLEICEETGRAGIVV